MRLTIRDLMWFTLVIALVLGWIIDNRNQHAEIAKFIRMAVEAEDRASDYKQKWMYEPFDWNKYFKENPTHASQ